MTKFEVKLSFNDWEDGEGKRKSVIQRHSGKDPKKAAIAAKENLWDEYGNNAENIKVISVKKIVSKPSPTSAKKKISLKKR